MVPTVAQLDNHRQHHELVLLFEHEHPTVGPVGETSPHPGLSHYSHLLGGHAGQSLRREGSVHRHRQLSGERPEASDEDIHQVRIHL